MTNGHSSGARNGTIIQLLQMVDEIREANKMTLLAMNRRSQRMTALVMVLTFANLAIIVLNWLIKCP